jgi:hypothetical protein
MIILLSALLSALVGGALAILGAQAGARAVGRGELDRWRRDTQLRLNTELLGALQQVVRRLIHLAYLQEKPAKATPVPAPLDYHEAMAIWNSSIYAALLISPPNIAGLVIELDREVDRLIQRATERQWSRLEFREERRALDRLIDAYLTASRAEAGWPALPIETITSWEEDAEASANPPRGEPAAQPQPAD